MPRERASPAAARPAGVRLRGARPATPAPARSRSVPPRRPLPPSRRARPPAAPLPSTRGKRVHGIVHGLARALRLRLALAEPDEEPARHRPLAVPVGDVAAREPAVRVVGAAPQVPAPAELVEELAVEVERALPRLLVLRLDAARRVQDEGELLAAPV